MNGASARRVRVLIVDDSVVTREIICDHLAQSPGIEVAGVACDGCEALRVFDSVRPDVVTLDVHMPNMDGLATLDALFDRKSVPVIMVSSLTQLGADTTFEALDRGALDYVAKPDRGSETEEIFGSELVRKIRNAAGADVQRILRIRRERKLSRRHKQRACPPASPASSSGMAHACIAIGVSTGGPPALTGLFAALRPPMPPILVVQHMPPQFTKPLAWRLNSLSELSIQEAAGGEVPRPNHVLIAPGGRHMELRRHGGLVKTVLSDGPPVSSHKPSVDVMMQSVAAIFGPNCLGVIMTGMGRDGVEGCRSIRQAGGYVLGQNEATSDVYGMNKVAYVEGCVNRQFALDEAPSQIAQEVRRLLQSSPAPAHWRAAAKEEVVR